MSREYRRFVITGDARTGSNMLAQALNTNPAIRCFREIFNYWQEHVDYFVEGYDPNVAEDLALRQTDPVRFLQERIFNEHPPHIESVGFKYLYGHFWGFDALTEHLSADRELLVVHLKRRNLLRSFVSVRLAEETNRWIEDWGIQPARRSLPIRGVVALAHPAQTYRKILRKLTSPPPEERKPELVLPPDECARFFARTRHEIERVDAMFETHSVLAIHYEDMVADREVVFADIQRFVGVAPVSLTVTLRKQNPEPLRRLVKNYDELKAAFAGTLEAVFFED